MTVESKDTFAIATLRHWLKKLARVSQPMRSKTKTNRTLYARFFPRLNKSQKNARNSDWFIALFAPVVIDRN